MLHAKRRLHGLSALLIALMLSSCASLFGGDGVKEKPAADVALATQVKAALIAKMQTSAAAIYVEAASGVVHLSGFVDSEGQRQLASQVASQVVGVQQVRNEIKVKSS